MSERYFPDTMPPPMADGTSLPWWKAAAEHRLVVQECGACQVTRLPPSPVCPDCRSDQFGWREVSGEGEVYTFTRVHRPLGAGQAIPFIIAVIALDGSGGLRMISNVVEIEADAVAIGMRVELVWEDMSPDLAIPRFRPATN